VPQTSQWQQSERVGHPPLVSLAFNAGPVSVKSSNQMMRAVNAGNVTEENFTAYRFVHVNGQAVVSQGLLRRREDEYSMYSEGKY
jgi:GH24 family phage-related lysozyme (muramidase)